LSFSSVNFRRDRSDGSSDFSLISAVKQANPIVPPAEWEQSENYRGNGVGKRCGGDGGDDVFFVKKWSEFARRFELVGESPMQQKVT
jgi:hypothetical protein